MSLMEIFLRYTYITKYFIRNANLSVPSVPYNKEIVISPVQMVQISAKMVHINAQMVHIILDKMTKLSVPYYRVIKHD